MSCADIVKSRQEGIIVHLAYSKECRQKVMAFKIKKGLADHKPTITAISQAELKDNFASLD
jgi:hypothetical protein